MSPRLLAISDLHVNHGGNLDAIGALRDHEDDWLIVAGDVADRDEHIASAFDVLRARFARVLWVPGNHELWSTQGAARGEARYRELVTLARDRGVDTPEDPWPVWGGVHLCLLFLLYDYSFAPDGLTPAEAVAWAAEDGIRCVDEALLFPDPWPSRQAWCHARVEAAERRLADLDGAPTVLINHFPLRYDLIRLYRIPRFSPWCGTRRTEDWHTRFRAEVVVSGHLHMRATDWRDGVRFEEVSLGYPRHWRPDQGVEGYLRTILPSPPGPRPALAGPEWHR